MEIEFRFYGNTILVSRHHCIDWYGGFNLGYAFLVLNYPLVVWHFALRFCSQAANSRIIVSRSEIRRLKLLISQHIGSQSQLLFKQLPCFGV